MMPEYSPTLAVVTGLIEVAAGIFTLSGPGRKALLRTVAAILFLLAGYQFAEVAVCARPGTLALSRLAFFVILWLPPVGIRLVVELADRRAKGLRAVSRLYFGAAAGLAVWILADPGCITRSVCQVVMARYFPEAAFDIAYGVFYQTGLLIMVFGAGALMASSSNALARKHLTNVQLGVLGFMFPALAVRVLADEPAGLLPSVMCHFAVVLAASLLALVVRERRAAGAVPEITAYRPSVS